MIYVLVAISLVLNIINLFIACMALKMIYAIAVVEPEEREKIFTEIRRKHKEGK